MENPVIQTKKNCNLYREIPVNLKFYQKRKKPCKLDRKKMLARQGNNVNKTVKFITNQIIP